MFIAAGKSWVYKQIDGLTEGEKRTAIFTELAEGDYGLVIDGDELAFGTIDPKGLRAYISQTMLPVYWVKVLMPRESWVWRPRLFAINNKVTFDTWQKINLADGYKIDLAIQNPSNTKFLGNLPPTTGAALADIRLIDLTLAFRLPDRQRQGEIILENMRLANYNLKY